METVDQEQCLRDECSRAVFARGLCHSCYTVASQLVAKGKTTWEKLIANGKAREVHRHRRPKSIASWLLADTKG